MLVAGTFSSIFMLLAASVGLITLVPVAIDQVTDSSSLFTKITESVVEIYKFFYSVFEFFTNIIKILPTPFATLISTFLVIMFSVFVWKLIKAGDL